MIKSVNRACILLIIGALLFFSACGYTYTVEGTVLDSQTEQPLEGAYVYFCLRMGPDDSMYTGPDGKFELEASDFNYNIAGDDSVEFRVSKDGYLDYEEQEAFVADSFQDDVVKHYTIKLDAVK